MVLLTVEPDATVITPLVPLVLKVIPVAVTLPLVVIVLDVPVVVRLREPLPKLIAVAEVAILLAAVTDKDPSVPM